METTEVLKKHERSFNKIRRMMQFLVVLIVAAIIYINQTVIIQFAKWLWKSI